MSSRDVLGIFLSSSGSRGDHLLFRFPYDGSSPSETYNDSIDTNTDSCSTLQASRSGASHTRKNPFAVRITEDYQAVGRTNKGSCIENGMLVGLSDKVLANLMAVKSNLCCKKYEVKVDDVIFVGYPMLLHPVSLSQTACNISGSGRRDSPTIISFNMVFAVRASVDRDKLACYHNLTKQLAVALRHEERRCGLLTKLKNIMWAIEDDVAGMPEDSMESPYKLILEKCHLAQQLKLVYDDLCNSGVVQIYINKWIHVNWCLPQKRHSVDHLTLIKTLRPFHGMLLLTEENSILESLPVDASPTLHRLVRVSSPFKNLQDLASDADLSLAQVYQLVIHLVYWNKATIIYPLCEANVYVLSPNIGALVDGNLVEKFMESFPGVSLPAVLADFSVPSALGDHKDVLGLPQEQVQEVQIVTWLLQHSLLAQLHTYVFLAPRKPNDVGLNLNNVQAHNSSNKQLLSPMVSEEPWRFRTISGSSDVNSIASDESQPASNISVKSMAVSDVAEEWMDPARWQLTTEQVVAMLKATQQNQPTTSKAAPTSTENTEDIKLFAKLSPYFNGKHHLEEMMYNENERRSQLLTLLDKFRDLLVTCQHEDPGISSY